MNKKFNIYDLISLTVCSMIGSPIYYSTSILLNDLKSPILVVGCYIISGAISLLFCICFIELFERSKTYETLENNTDQNISKKLGITYFLFTFFVIYPLIIGIMLKSIVIGITAYFEINDIRYSLIVTIVIIILASIILVSGNRVISIIAKSMVILKYLGILYVITLGVLTSYKYGSVFKPAIFDVRADFGVIRSLPNLLNCINTSLVGYEGWNTASLISSKAKNSGIIVPKTMLTSIFLSIISYTIISVLYFFILPYMVILRGNVFLNEYLNMSPLGNMSNINILIFKILPSIGSFLACIFVASCIKEKLFFKNILDLENTIFYFIFAVKIVFLVILTEPEVNIAYISPLIYIWYFFSFTRLAVLKSRRVVGKTNNYLPKSIVLLASAVSLILFMNSIFNFFTNQTSENAKFYNIIVHSYEKNTIDFKKMDFFLKSKSKFDATLPFGGGLDDESKMK